MIFLISHSFALTSSGWDASRSEWQEHNMSVPVMFSTPEGWRELRHLRFNLFEFSLEFNSVNQTLTACYGLGIDQILWIQRGDKPHDCPSEETGTIQIIQ